MICNQNKPCPTCIPTSCMRCEACDPQQRATKVQAKTTLLRLLASNASFFSAISFHFFAFSPTPRPDLLLSAVNPQSANLFSSSSATLSRSSSPTPGLRFNAEVCVTMLTTTDSTRLSEDNIDFTRETHEPHIIPPTSRRIVEFLESGASIFRDFAANDLDGLEIGLLLWLMNLMGWRRRRGWLGLGFGERESLRRGEAMEKKKIGVGFVDFCGSLKTNGIRIYLNEK